VIIRVVGVARLALEALLSPSEVRRDQTVRQVVLTQEGTAVLLALGHPVGCFFLAVKVCDLKVSYLNRSCIVKIIREIN